MPSARTLVTEIATGLGCTGHDNVEAALRARPAAFVNVPAAVWDALDAEWARPARRVDFEGAWRNGRALLEAADGLRGRPPLRIEWKGPHRPPAYEFLPADLRIDHVFLVSCKHDSRVIANTSPSHLFDRLQWGQIEDDRGDWYLDVAAPAYQAFYDAVRAEPSAPPRLPSTVGALDAGDRRALKGAFAGRWPDSLREPYAGFSRAVAEASAARWREATSTKRRRELAFWRLLRMGAAPYFLLGADDRGSLRIRVGTPWDWQQRFRLVAFGISAEAADQPRVRWEARVRALDTSPDSPGPDGESEWTVAGHVEIRWSHGRFAQPPEAKVYLDTPHHRVPGYFPLA